jgi:hypothetical protein
MLETKLVLYFIGGGGSGGGGGGGKRWQPLYDVIRKTVFPRVEFRRGIPMDLDSEATSSIPEYET